MKRCAIVLSMIFFTQIAGWTQERVEDFKPNGKPILRIYSNFHATHSDGETDKAFELTRVYLGYEHFFSENFSGKAIYDVADPGAGKHQLSAFVKIAELKYRFQKLDVCFGLIATTQYKIQEDFWANRYVLKSFQDEYGFAPSADLGVSVSYDFTDWMSADLGIFNGEGYKKLQSDDILKTAIGLTFTPAEGFTVRGLYDWMGDETVQQSWTTFAGYKNKKFSLGAEYNLQKNQAMMDSRDWWGTSIYTSYIPSKKIKIFGRYDNLASEKIGTADWNISNDGQLIMLGLEYAPVKGLKFSPNYQGWNPSDESKSFRSGVFVNCELRF